MTFTQNIPQTHPLVTDAGTVRLPGLQRRFVRPQYTPTGEMVVQSSRGAHVLATITAEGLTLARGGTAEVRAALRHPDVLAASAILIYATAVKDAENARVALLSAAQTFKDAGPVTALTEAREPSSSADLTLLTIRNISAATATAVFAERAQRNASWFLTAAAAAAAAAQAWQAAMATENQAAVTTEFGEL